MIHALLKFLGFTKVDCEYCERVVKENYLRSHQLFECPPYLKKMGEQWIKEMSVYSER